MRDIYSFVCRIRKAILLGGIVISLSLPGIGQDLTSSPYSRFGIGDIFSKNYGRGQAMGGLGIGLRSDRDLNLINPASLGRMDTMHFQFEIGLFDKATFYRTENLQSFKNNASLSYIGMGFPITKWWAGSAGIIPLSGVKYYFSDTEQIPQIGQISSEFQGDGGISQFFFSQAIEPVKYISLGLNFEYVFGPINHYKSLVFPTDSLFFSTNSTSTAKVGDIHLGYGIQADIPLKNNYFLILGGIFENKSSLKAESQKLVYNTGLGVIDTLLYDINEESSIILPTSWGAGFSFGRSNKFTLGVDYSQQNWTESEFIGQKDSLGNSQKLIMGFEYIPDAFSPISYSKRIRYRAGFHYSKSHIQLRGSQIQDFGINFGVGLPVSMDRFPRKHTFNISAEIGKRGTIKNDLISEYYGLFTVQFNLHDVWFVKRKYD